MTKNIINLLFLFVLISCQNGNKNHELSNLPRWYIHPQQNDSQYLYGVGEGYSLEETTKSALSDAAARLSVSISQNSNLIREENNYSSNEEFRESIKQNVEEINFANFVVEKSDQIAEKYYVQVKIDKQQFVNLQKEQISFLDRQVRNLLQDLSLQNIVRKRNSLIEALDFARKSEILTRIVYADNGDHLKNKLKTISDLKLKLSRLNNKFEFYFASKSPNKIYNLIKNAANKEKITIANVERNSQSQIKIRIRSSRQVSEIYGSYITKMTIWFDNIANDKVIASNSIEITGSSTINSQQSYVAAINSLKEKIEQEGVLKILGIK